MNNLELRRAALKTASELLRSDAGAIADTDVQQAIENIANELLAKSEEAVEVPCTHDECTSTTFTVGTAVAVECPKCVEISSQPWLGNATTGHLLDEIRARVDVNYRTVDSEFD